MKHEVIVQSWGHHPVVVCLTCASPKGPNGLVLLRRDVTLTYDEIVNATRAHCDDQPEPPSPVAGERIDTDTVSFVAWGEPDEFGPGYHPRTGQKLEEVEPLLVKGYNDDKAEGEQ